jgi:drug/metabolite transporter (DMT)-like permease
VLSLSLAILSSASLALIFRVTEARGYRRLAVTFGNYVTATITALALLWIERGASNGAPAVESRVVLAVGIPGGLLFFLGFLLYQRAVAQHGPGLAGMYGKLGVLVPMLLSMLVWREYPAAVQVVGMLLAVAAIVVSQRAPAGGGALMRPLLLAQLMVMGFAEFSNKVWEYYGGIAGRSAFLALLFAVAMVAAGATLMHRRWRPTAVELRWGIAVGVPNLFSSFFLISALDQLPAAVVFPAFSAGAIVVIALAAWALYGDRLSPRQWAAIALTAAALVLINR